jgi:hypothetical protein
MKARTKFYELLEESVLVQAGITLAVTLTVCLLLLLPPVVQIFEPDLVIEANTPKELWAVLGLVYGYYFGTKKDLSHRKELEIQRQQTTDLLRELAVAKQVILSK